jgi:hypothetical protein
VRAVGTAGVQRMLDVEGGSGAYSIAFVQAGPELRAEVLDRAELLAIAQGHIDRAGLAGRVTTRAAAWSSRTSSWSLDFGLLEGGQSCPPFGPQGHEDRMVSWRPIGNRPRRAKTTASYKSP